MKQRAPSPYTITLSRFLPRSTGWPVDATRSMISAARARPFASSMIALETAGQTRRKEVSLSAQSRWHCAGARRFTPRAETRNACAGPFYPSRDSMLIVSDGNRYQRNSGRQGSREGRVHAGMGDHEDGLGKDLQLRSKGHHQQVPRSFPGSSTVVAPPRDMDRLRIQFPPFTSRAATASQQVPIAILRGTEAGT